MNTIELEPRTQKALDWVRHRSKVLSLYEMPADLAELAVWEIGKLLLENQGLMMVQYNQYRWFLRELAKLLRNRTGWDLALELEISLRKWAAYKLDPELLQALLCECYDHIAVMTPDQVEIRADAGKSEVRSSNDDSTRKARMAETAGVGDE